MIIINKKYRRIRNIRPLVFLLASLVMLSVVGIKQVVYGAELWERGLNVFSEYMDKKTYLCMELEDVDALDNDEYSDLVNEDIKKDCKQLLQDADYFKKKELIQKYGEFR